MTYNSLVSERFATYQINIALLDNGTDISLNTREIKHHLSTSKQSHKNWRYELLSTNSCLDDYLRSKRFIIRCFVLVKDTNLYFLTMWVVHKGLHINNQKQNNQKWNIPCLKYGPRTTNPPKSLPQTLHSILDSLCCPLSLCGMSWLPLATERNIIICWNYERTHKLTYGTHDPTKTVGPFHVFGSYSNLHRLWHIPLRITYGSEEPLDMIPMSFLIKSLASRTSMRRRPWSDKKKQNWLSKTFKKLHFCVHLVYCTIELFKFR